VEANLNAQKLRRAGKLDAARTQLRTCSAAACPPALRDDCAQRIDELDHAQPTIVFDVKDAEGADIADVSVTMDGAPIAQRLSGTAFSLDPGSHELVFTVAGQAPIHRTLVLAENVKGRHELIVVGAKAEGMSTIRLLGLIAGGAGVVGIAVGSVFGGLTISEASTQKGACSTSMCSQTNLATARSAHSSATGDGAVSTAAFVAGGALIATGVVLYLVGRPDDPRATRGTLAPVVGPGQAGLMWSAAF
jgi:hypothetical protein